MREMTGKAMTGPQSAGWALSRFFFNKPLLLVPDAPHNIDEERIPAFGAADNRRLLHISFTLPENKTLIRIWLAEKAGASR
jgi:uncharacterized DUF497 family protein